MNKVLFLASMLVLTAAGFGASHVFWYKAVANGYGLQQANPGPAIPAGAEVHEGILMSACVAQHTGNAGDLIVVGSGLDDLQGRCGVVWSKDLCEMSGSCASARFRAEYRDGWSGNAYCNAGHLSIRCGVVDFQGNIDVWGAPADVSETATWQDFLNPLGSTMGYDMGDPSLMAEETIEFTASAGRPSESEPSVLDGRFVEIDVTDQVNWILANTGGNKGSRSGQYAIVFLVAPGQGDIGKFNTYGSENCSGNAGSDNPWTADGNTTHFLVEGDLTIGAEQGAAGLPVSGAVLGRNLPNPFSASTAVAYNTGDGAGKLAIYAPDGRLVCGSEVRGAGSFSWNAEGLTSGIYVARLTVGKRAFSRTMILMK